MIKTKLPSAIVLGWDRTGRQELRSDIYWEENLHENIILYCDSTVETLVEDFAKYSPDLIITFGDQGTYRETILGTRDIHFLSKWLHYRTIPADNILANDVVCQSTFWSCTANRRIYNGHYFSVFTPAYKTANKIERTYKSLVEQTYQNWEWIVVDDSPAEHTRTYSLLQALASKDYRVKPVRIFPTSGGNIGEAKHRAASLANGNWLVELDHDDYLMPDALQTLIKASQAHPDAGFLYSDCCEMYEDGEMRQYGRIGEDWYGHPENNFDWGYAGHTWQNIGGKDYLVHHYPNINPKSIRFNIGMPNHVRVWRKDVYNRVGGHNRFISVADDFELIVKTFLETKFVHITKMLYIQYNNRSSTVDLNSVDINRRARLIRDAYDKQIHERIINLGAEDWNWNEETQSSYKLQNWMDPSRYGAAEQVLNYIYTPNE